MELIKNVNIFGLRDSIKGAKYPMSVDIDKLDDSLTHGIKKLFNAEIGSGHDQALTGIIVQFDLTCPVKMWTEIQRYHFVDFVSSQSTMHRITRFDLDEQYDSYVDSRIVDIMKQLVSQYNENASNPDYDPTILQHDYLEILMSNPCGFNLTARLTTNYRQLKTIYAQRKNHRLPQWREFCKWIEELPCSNWITGEENAVSV